MEDTEQPVASLVQAGLYNRDDQRLRESRRTEQRLRTLERAAVAEAFSTSVTLTSAIADQIEFVGWSSEHLTETGDMDPRLLP